MGKNDKERLKETPKSVVTPELLAHMYDQTPPSRDVFVRTNTGRIMPATIKNSSPLEIRRAIDGDGSVPLNGAIQRGSPQRQSSEHSQRGPRQKYKNKPRPRSYKR